MTLPALQHAPPTAAEWEAQTKQAEMLAGSGLVPEHFRGKPADILVAALTARELGMGPMWGLQSIVVINGKPTINAEGRVALIRRAGHSISGSATASKAVVTGRRADTGDEMTVEWTIQMAQRAGLAGKGTWKQYPEAMLWARAVSQLCRMLFPDVLMGVSYEPEEIGGDAAVSTPGAPVPPGVDAETGEIVDGEIVDDGQDSGAATPSEPEPQQSFPPPKPAAADSGPPAPASLVRSVCKALREAGVDSDEGRHNFCEARYGVRSSRALTRAQAMDALRFIATQPEQTRELAAPRAAVTA